MNLYIATDIYFLSQYVHQQENDYDKYQYYLINGNTEMANIYEPIIAIEDGLAVIGVLLVIISFPIMIIGLLFMKNKNLTKQ